MCEYEYDFVADNGVNYGTKTLCLDSDNGYIGYHEVEVSFEYHYAPSMSSWMDYCEIDEITSVELVRTVYEDENPNPKFFKEKTNEFGTRYFEHKRPIKMDEDFLIEMIASQDDNFFNG